LNHTLAFGYERKALSLRDWASLSNLDHIADFGGVALIVHQEFLRATEVLLVLWVFDVPLYGNGDGISHFG
jgi:hypothetical protein